jgi:hypothetical protein
MYALWVPMAIRLERLEMHDEELRGFAVKRGRVGDLAQSASGKKTERGSSQFVGERRS